MLLCITNLYLLPIPSHNVDGQERGQYGGQGGFQQQSYQGGYANQGYQPQAYPQQQYGMQQHYGGQPMYQQQMYQPQQPMYGQPGIMPPVQASPWRSATAADGQVYYYNQNTGETTWDKPGVFLLHGFIDFLDCRHLFSNCL